jgi:sec-independent protein translocase protein TatA
MFGRLGPLEIILIAAVLLVVFGGRGRISSMMGDMAKGIRSFRQGLKDGEKPEETPEDPKRPTLIGEKVAVSEQEKTKA